MLECSFLDVANGIKLENDLLNEGENEVGEGEQLESGIEVFLPGFDGFGVGYFRAVILG